MDKLELWLPAKPWVVTQAWGIFNPAYSKFGFDHHNGIDFLPGADNKLYCPVRNFVVYDVGQTNDMGFYVKGVTKDVYGFPDGKTAKIYMVFMHGQELSPLKVGQEIQVGDFMMIPDNTGFSTGPHTHWYCARVDQFSLQDLDENNADHSFDQSIYFNTYYAVDSSRVESVLKTISVFNNLILNFPILATWIGRVLVALQDALSTMRK